MDHLTARYVQLVREVRRRTVTDAQAILDEWGGDREDVLDKIGQLVHAEILARANNSVQLYPKAGALLGVDLGFDIGMYVRSNLGFGDVACEPLLAIDMSKPITVLHAVARAVRNDLDYLSRVPPVGIAISLPGPISTDGVPAGASILPEWDGLQLPDLLGEALEHEGVEPMPMTVGNDASFGALGVFTRGVLHDHRRAAQDLLYVRVTNGIGAGLVLKGHLVKGAEGFAGELGHLRVDQNGPLCPRCGARGCLEALADEDAVVDKLRATFRMPDASAKQLLSLRHPAVDTALWEAGWHLGLGVAQAITLLNPARVVVAGRLTARASFFTALRQSVDRNAIAPSRATAHRIVTWTSIRNAESGPQPWRRLGPEHLGVLAGVVDELGNTFLENRVLSWRASERATRARGKKSGT